MLVRDSSSRKRVGAVLLVTFSVLANAQTYVSKLLPPPELLKPALQPGTLAQDPAANVGLHIEILSGDRGINIIKKKTAVKPVVEVRDRNNLPVAGAAVIFSSPSDGPSVVFLNGSRSITVITDSVGRATTTGLKPLNPGNFQIDVSASFHSQSAKTSIAMTNALTATAAAATAAGVGGTVATGAGAGGLSTGVIVALVAVAAGAAVGIGVGLGHHGSTATTSTTTSVTIGVGTGGTVGSPHLKHGLNLRF
jgi:hypothetical protein